LRRTMVLAKLPLASLCAGVAGVPVAGTMQAAMATEASCFAPDFDCISVTQTSVPVPSSQQALVKVNAASISPSDWKMLQGSSPHCQALGVLGNDAAGTVVKCPGCTRLKVGDKVWGSTGHAMGEYLVVDEGRLGVIPENLNLTEAATIPEVGLTGISVLKTGGAPWTGRKNLTVVVTSGAGGTGFIGIQLAKAYGAAHVIVSASRSSFDFVKALGADEVVDYHEQDIFDYLADDSVDIVYDNYGTEGTGDRAMHAIRKGGAYLLLPNGGCFTNRSQAYPCVAANPKEGVANINVVTASYFSDPAKVTQSLDELKGFFEGGVIEPRIERQYALEEARAAYAEINKGHVHGKLSIQIESGVEVVEVVV